MNYLPNKIMSNLLQVSNDQRTDYMHVSNVDIRRASANINTAMRPLGIAHGLRSPATQQLRQKCNRSDEIKWDKRNSDKYCKK